MYLLVSNHRRQTIPWFVNFVGASEILMRLSKDPWLGPLLSPKPMQVFYDLLSEAVEDRRAHGNTVGKPHFIDTFVNGKHADGQPLIPNPVVAYGEAATAITGGSDSTAWTLAAALSCVLRSPNVLKTLETEVLGAHREGKLSEPVVNWTKGASLDYVQAVLRETLRIYPMFTGRLTRESPPGGMNILGQWVPEGVELGNCLTVVQRDKEIFGEDADEFSPERWLPLDGERAKEMERFIGTWGFGTRTCLGKSIAQMELTKGRSTCINSNGRSLVANIDA